MRIPILLLILLIAIGCAPQFRLVKDGITQTQADRDNYECSQEAAQYAGSAYGGVGPFAVAMAQRDRMIQCMKMRGYREVPLQ